MKDSAISANVPAPDLANAISLDFNASEISPQTILQTRKLRHWSSVCCLAFSDVVAFAFAAVLFRVGHNVPKFILYHRLLPASFLIDVFYLLAAIFIVFRYVFGDYSRRQLFWDGARLTTIGLLIVAIPDFLALFFTNAHYSAIAAIGAWSFLLVAIPSFRQIARWILSRMSLWQLPTVLVGTGPDALEAYDAFSKSLSLGFDVRFLVTSGDAPEVTNAISGVTRISLRDPANITRQLSNAGCLEAVLAIDGRPDTEVDDLIQRFMAAGMGVAIIPPLRRLPLFGLTTNYFFGRDLLLLQVRNNLAHLPGRFFKRLVDVIGSIILLVLSVPVYAIVTLLIRLNDAGPVFFLQRRIGQAGREFDCVKFRTMALDAEEQLGRWQRENSQLYEEYRASNFKLRHDPRVTRVGRWLRRTSLDELPQLINVLLGEMSLVGPRPILEREITEYGPAFKLYQQIRPGITGLWQITGRSHTSFAERVSSDEWYIKNWSFWYDVVILLKTVWILMTQDGAY